MTRRTLVLIAVCMALLLPTTWSPSQAAGQDQPIDSSQPAGSTAPREMPVLARSGNRDFSNFPCNGGAVPAICRITRFPGRPFMVLWGDSHALMYLSAVKAVARNRRVNLVSIYSGGCPLGLPAPRTAQHPWITCDKHNAGSLDYVTRLARKHRTRVIIGSYWEHYRTNYALMQREARTGQDAGLSEYERHVAKIGAVESGPMFTRLGKLRIRADVLAQAGVVGLDPPNCRAGNSPYQCNLPRRAALPHEADNSRWLASRARRLVGSPRTIDPVSEYCSATTCFPHVGRNNTYYDFGHLGEQMTLGTKRFFKASFKNFHRI